MAPLEVRLRFFDGHLESVSVEDDVTVVLLKATVAPKVCGCRRHPAAERCPSPPPPSPPPNRS